jgi:hypothetical protein
MKFQDTSDFPSIRGPMTSTREAPPSPYGPHEEVDKRQPTVTPQRKKKWKKWGSMARHRVWITLRHPVTSLRAK